MLNRIYHYCVMLVITWLFAHTAANAQANRYRFLNLNSENGLSQNTVNTIVQDPYGFIWLGTNNGLNRYDGYRIETYFNSQTDSLSLSNNQIISLCSDTKGRLWVGTSGGGVNIFNRQTNSFERMVFSDSAPNSISSNDITVIFEDPDGNIWVGTKNGLNRFIEDSHHFERYFQTPDSLVCLANNFVTAIHSSHRGYIWIGTLGGLNKYNTNTGKFEVYTKGKSCGLNDNSVLAIYEDQEGKVWVGTETGAMNVYNANKNIWYHYGYEPTERESRGANSVNAIVSGLNGDIWVGSNDGGVYQFNDGEDSYFRVYRHIFGIPETLTNNEINGIYVSSDNVLWIGLLDGGVDRIDLQQQPFLRLTHVPGDKHTLNVHRVNHIFFDSDDNLWVGTHGGLNLRRKGNDGFEYFSEFESAPFGISNNRVYNILEVGHQIWLGTYLGGINIYNKKTGRFNYLTHNPDDTNTLPANFVRTTYKDAKNRIWVGTVWGGLSEYNAQTNNFTTTVFPSIEGTTEKKNNVMRITGDNNETLYVGTWGDGVVVANTQSGKPMETQRLSETSGLTANNVTDLYIDSDSLLWIGTSFGLNSYNLQTKELKKYFIQNGLPDNFIRAIIQGNDQRIWISTNQGLSAYNKRTATFTNYNREDGLQDIEFNYGAAEQDKQGFLYFGGATGITYFNPSQISDHQHTTKLKFTEVFMNNTKILPGMPVKGRVLLSEPLYKTDTLTIPRFNNFIELYFSTMEYLHVTKIRYRYKLGIDGEYMNVQSNNFIAFHNLRPGTYTIILEASAHDFSEPAENLNQTQLTLIIEGPFWQKLWGQVLLGLIIVLIALIFYFLRISAIRRQKMELEALVFLRTQELQETNVLLEENQAELEMQQEELISQRDLAEEQSLRIKEQNKELALHQENLEKLINVRTQELLKAKTKAEMADALKTRFLANMSHEIRTPMNAILGFISLLDDPGYSAEERTLFKSLVNKSGESLINLINDIIDIAKIESGQLTIQIIEFKLETVFNELYLQYTKIVADEKHAVVLVMDDNKPCTINSDDLRIRQVIINLLNNAVKFTDSGSITMGYTIKKDYVLVYVSDTGIGIKKDSLSSIFERFHKLDESNGKLYRGTGLGLAISKNIIELIGGKIWVESEPGEGSTFWFTIPILEKSTKG